MEIFKLTGETAVVVGGTGALGGAMAEGLAAAGARVAILGRNIERGEARAQQINLDGGQAEFFATDALSRESLRTAREQVETVLGAPTVLVNAAGGTDPNSVISGDRTVDKLTIEAWTRNFDLNLVGGALYPCQEFGSAMVAAGKGSIINIASVSAHVSLSKMMAYSASKAAVLNLTQFLAREWATQGVRVNSITPGFFPADQNRHALFNPDGSMTPRAKTVIGHTPMARFGDPRELIGAAIFLASAKASGFVTGTDIRVDGGFLSFTI